MTRDRTDAAGAGGESAGSWDAISAAFARVHGPREPLHMGTVVSFALGGKDPLDGISFYARDDHWHVVSYGLSELYTARRDPDGLSGFGFELTMRVEDRTRPKPRADQPSKTPPSLLATATLLQDLARYVWRSKSALAHGHSMQLRGEGSDPASGKWAGVIFASDPEVPPIETPSGRVEFVQVVGLSAAEFRAAQLVGARAFVEFLREIDPLLVSRMSRPCLMTDAAFADRVARHLAEHGSTRNAVGARLLRFETIDGRARIGLPRREAEALRDGLRHVVSFGREFAVGGPEGEEVFFKPEPAAATDTRPGTGDGSSAGSEVGSGDGTRDATREDGAPPAADRGGSVMISREDARTFADAFPAQGTTWSHPSIASLSVEILPDPAPADDGSTPTVTRSRGPGSGKRGCLSLVLAGAAVASAGVALILAAIC